MIGSMSFFLFSTHGYVNFDNQKSPSDDFFLAK